MPLFAIMCSRRAATSGACGSPNGNFAAKTLLSSGQEPCRFGCGSAVFGFGRHPSCGETARRLSQQKKPHGAYQPVQSQGGNRD